VSQETRRPQFTDYFRDFVEDKLKESFDNLNDITRSKYMARFFAERVLAPRNPLLPTVEEDIQACVVDAKGDQGVDFICRENGVVLVIQAKYSGGGKKVAKRRPEDPADFEHFRTVFGRLRNFRTIEMYEPLRELCAGN